MLADLENDYDWTLIYKEITKESIDKKKIIQQFQVMIGIKVGIWTY